MGNLLNGCIGTLTVSARLFFQASFCPPQPPYCNHLATMAAESNAAEVAGSRCP
jgi:hypothetical protein